MRLFAPLYLSNECINNCRYCGFSRDNPILRVTLSLDQVAAEGRYLAQRGISADPARRRRAPEVCQPNYLADCVRALAPDFSSISIEVGPMETADYRPIVEAGAEGLVVYQETYDREDLRRAAHRRAKARFQLAARLRGARLRGGISADGHWRAVWTGSAGRQEALALAAHVEYLLKHCWQAQITVSLPRIASRSR